MQGAGDRGESAERLDRRALVGGAAVGLAGAWVVPVVVTRAAASAATTEPGPCPGCGGELVVNGNAESGVMVPWQAPNAADHVVDWAYAAIWGLSPGVSDGVRTFFFGGSVADFDVASMTQSVSLDPGCGGFGVTLAVDVAERATSGGFGELTIGLEFFDAGAASLGDGGASPILRSTATGTTAATSYASSGAVPAGSASLSVSLGWTASNADPDEPVVVACAADAISVVIACP